MELEITAKTEFFLVAYFGLVLIGCIATVWCLFDVYVFVLFVLFLVVVMCKGCGCVVVMLSLCWLCLFASVLVLLVLPQFTVVLLGVCPCSLLGAVRWLLFALC